MAREDLIRKWHHEPKRNRGWAFSPRQGIGVWIKPSILMAFALLLQPNKLRADIVPVRHQEGLMHGFLIVQTLDGKALADGQLTQNSQNGDVTDHLIFRFKDGSLYEETTVFSQRGAFYLSSDHLVQKGPSFKQPLDTSIDTGTGQVRVRYMDDNGKEQVLSKRLDLPPDVANGLLLTLLKDVKPTVPRTTVSMVVTTPEPLLIKLAIVPQGEESFKIGSFSHKAMHYVVKAEIGGVKGFLARLTSKQPPDTHVWVLGGDAPAFVKLEGPLYTGGPIWRVKLAAAGLF
jgi:hypothetical protein